MALVSCLECGNPVSEEAVACTNCGRLLDEGPIRTHARIPPLATVGQRVVARAIDAIIVYVVGSIIIGILFPGVAFLAAYGAESGIVSPFVIFGGVWVLYFTLLEAGGLRTLGKAAAGVRVTAGDHLTPISIAEAFVRNLVLVIPLLWLISLGVMALDTVRRQGFHDRLVGTLVVMSQ